MGFTKLDEGILQSSVMAEDSDTFKVWIAVLASCGPDGVAGVSSVFLSSVCHLDIGITRASLEKLERPDPDSRSEAEEGRRIIRIDGGYKVVNYEKYRGFTYSKTNEAIRKRSYRHGERKLRSGYIYFAGNESRIKIGFSSNPWARINELKIADPDLKLLAAYKGTSDDEKKEQKKFKKFHIAREWYQRSPEIEKRLLDVAGHHGDVVGHRGTVVGQSASASASASASLGKEKTKKDPPLTPPRHTATEVSMRIEEIQGLFAVRSAVFPGHIVEYIASLTFDFPDIDWKEEIERKLAYMKDHLPGKGANIALQFRNWFLNARKFAARDARDRSVGSQQPAGAAPGTGSKTKAELLEIAQEAKVEQIMAKYGPRIEAEEAAEPFDPEKLEATKSLMRAELDEFTNDWLRKYDEQIQAGSKEEPEDPL